MTAVQGQSLLSTMDSTQGNIWVVYNDGFTIAEGFTTGNTSEDIGSVSFLMRGWGGSGDPLTIGIYSDNSGQPGSLVANGSLTGPASLTGYSANTFSASGLTLAADTSYWLVFDNTSATSVGLVNRQGGDLVTSSSDGWTLGQTGYKVETTAGPYYYGYTGVAEPLFTISAVPEPGTMALAALGGFGLLVLRRKK